NMSSSIENEERATLLDRNNEYPSENRILQQTVVKICASIAALIAFVCLISALVRGRDVSQQPLPYFNGTHGFNKTLIIVSLDGFRNDYLKRGLTPNIQKLAERGVGAKYMVPSFPSVTFPNHYTLVTGLYPESHGIVGNDFYDPLHDRDFYYTDPKRSFDSFWWGGEPIWVTAELQGRKSAVLMWVGSSAEIKHTRPTYQISFNASWTVGDKADQVLKWVDEEDDRASLIAVYTNQVDYYGHRFGPVSKQVDDALIQVDGMIGDMISGLEERNLTEIVDFIVVSDHGMATINASSYILLDQLLKESIPNFEDLIFPLEGFPLAGIRPNKPDAEVDILTNLQKVSHDQPFDCYNKVDVPSRFHYSKSDRIAPIVCIPEVGYVLTSTKFWNNIVSNGTHGFDNLAEEMRAIFMAQGPTFEQYKQRTGQGNVMDEFRNVEVYNIMAKILDLTPAPNNGTVGSII
ncbi:8460_t:CDS:2, partial [Paraglomus occultum]